MKVRYPATIYLILTGMFATLYGASDLPVMEMMHESALREEDVEPVQSFPAKSEESESSVIFQEEEIQPFSNQIPEEEDIYNYNESYETPEESAFIEEE